MHRDGVRCFNNSATDPCRTEQDLERLMLMTDPAMKGMLTFEKFVLLMEEDQRTQQIEETSKRLTEWKKAFSLFEIKVSPSG